MDTINSDTSFSASVQIKCVNGTVHSKTSYTRNSQNRVSTGTCYGDMGKIATYVIHSGSRTTLNGDVEYYRYSVYDLQLEAIYRGAALKQGGTFVRKITYENSAFSIQQNPTVFCKE